MPDLANLPPGTDLSKVALQEPPPGVEQNLVNPESTANTAIAVTVLFTILMFVFVCMRMYTKLFVSRAWGWDDCKSSGARAYDVFTEPVARYLHISLCAYR